jgi:hypothetical protein
VIRAPLTSHSLRNYRCNNTISVRLPFPFLLLLSRSSLLFQVNTMASRRTCISLLRQSETFASKASGASSSFQKFSSRSNSWTCATPRGINEARRRVSTSSRSLASMTPSNFQNRRQFSSTPAPRHGHLDTPKPGEECVICHPTLDVVTDGLLDATLHS